MLPGHTEEFLAIFGGAAVYYIVAATAVFLALIILSPLYLLISKFGMSNYLILFALGFFIVLAVYRFKMPLNELYFAAAGGVAYALFHYGYIKVFKV